MYYTNTLVVLSVICIYLLWRKRARYTWLSYLFPTICFTLFGTMEFMSFNSKGSPRPWEFNLEHISNIWIWNTAIEDVVFNIVLATLLFIIYISLDRRINSQPSHLGKLISITVLMLYASGLYMFGNEFGRYLCFRMSIGILGIILVYKTWDIKLFWTAFLLFIIPTMAWEIWAGNTEVQQWFYREGNEYSPLMSDLFWFQIGKAWYNLEIFPGYYVSGLVFFEGTLALLIRNLRRHQNDQKRIRPQQY